MDPKVAIETITPAVAEKWLEGMVTNRKISEALLLDYAIAIEQGNWSLNGETIKFDANGKLFDGQHRLRACMLAERAFQSYVVRGVADEHAFSTVDQGKQRTISDIFGLSGWLSSTTASAAANLLVLYEESRISWNGPIGCGAKSKSKIQQNLTHRARPRSAVQKEVALRFAQEHKEKLNEAVRFTVGHKANRILYGSVMAACYYLFAEKSRMQSESFFDELAEGTGLAADAPVWVLRERLLALSRNRDRNYRWVSIGLTIKTWNKRRLQEKMKQLFHTAAEEFPKVQ